MAYSKVDYLTIYTPVESTLIDRQSYKNPIDVFRQNRILLLKPKAKQEVIQETLLEEPEEITIDIQLYIPTPQSAAASIKAGPIPNLIKIDIEDLLKWRGLTSINGKPIKFGSKAKRPANASYGVSKSHHKEIDPHTGNANARDISIPNGSDEDYAEFRRRLISDPIIVEWFRLKNWGILNELTAAILKKTNGTARHFHFGPDTSARRTWAAWLNNPNILITKLI